MSLSTGTYLCVMEADTQAMIEAVMVRTGVVAGVGYLAREDVKQQLEETALIAARRYDGSVKFTTYFWRRLHGECIEMIRKHHHRTKRGTLRPLMISMDEGEPFDFEDETAENLDGVNRMADLTLALSRLPARLRMVLYLLFYEHLTVPEVGVRLCMTNDLVYGLRDAAMIKMRLALTESLDSSRVAPYAYSSQAGLLSRPL